MKNSIKIPRALYFIIFVVLLSIFLFFVVRAFNGLFVFPSEIKIGPLALKLYGLILLISIVSSAVVFENILKSYTKKYSIENIKKFDIYEALIWAFVPGIILARVVYYISFINDYYGGSFDDIFKIWEGGMSIFGAIIGGALGLSLYLKKIKVSLFPLMDFVFISIPVGHAIGRWANFINVEIYGPPTNLPWKMFVSPEKRGSIPLEFRNDSFFHPLFLYEFILNLILFGILLRFFKKNHKRFKGFFVGVYLIGYGAIRFFIEFLRFDPEVIFGLSVAQIISLLMIFTGTMYLLYRFRQAEVNGKN